MDANLTCPTRNIALPVATEALLGREPAQLGAELVRERVQGKVILVTGAAGSIGSELCRQIAALRPLALVGFDQAETPLFYLQRELAQKFPALAFHPEIGNATAPADVDWALERHRPAVIFHAAGYKHVPLMEAQPFAAVEINIFGALNVAKSAIRHNVAQFVLVSTDKAVRPSSLMGATKRAAEIAVHALQQPTGTRFIAVRFGNVLGSSGSVLPIFKDQIAAGGPVTVTHPEMQRYFMTASEAAQLLLESLVIGAGGETFVLDMGEPVSILDLAKNLIRLSGLNPGVDIPIEFTGIRPGEKLCEELSLGSQKLLPTAHAGILSLHDATPDPTQITSDNLRSCLQQLQQAIETRDSRSLVRLLQTLVPDYCPGSELSSSTCAAEAGPIHTNGPIQMHEPEFQHGLPALI